MKRKVVAFFLAPWQREADGAQKKRNARFITENPAPRRGIAQRKGDNRFPPPPTRNYKKYHEASIKSRDHVIPHGSSTGS